MKCVVDDSMGRDDSRKPKKCIHSRPQFLEIAMGLSTHVLDTMHGCPAAGMAVALYATRGSEAALVKRLVLNADGRNPAGPLYADGELQKGTYRLVFDVAGYFKARGVALPEPNFLGEVSLDFGVAHPEQHYHVPLLVSPWSYSTYRGS
jgi:5-hydroxyisourate hydrolase